MCACMSFPEISRNVAIVTVPTWGCLLEEFRDGRSMLLCASCLGFLLGPLVLVGMSEDGRNLPGWLGTPYCTLFCADQAGVVFYLIRVLL